MSPAKKVACSLEGSCWLTELQQATLDQEGVTKVKASSVALQVKDNVVVLVAKQPQRLESGRQPLGQLKLPRHDNR